MDILQLIHKYIVDSGPEGTKVGITEESDIKIYVNVDGKRVANCLLSTIYLKDLDTMDAVKKEERVLSLLSQLEKIDYNGKEVVQSIDLTPESYPKTIYI